MDHVADDLAPHKRPRAVHFLDELPRNDMGKVQKARLGTDVSGDGAPDRTSRRPTAGLWPHAPGYACRRLRQGR